MLYILSQIIVVVGVGIDLISKLFKKKVSLLLVSILAYMLYITSYALVKNLTAVFANLISLIRGILYYFFDNKNVKLVYYIITTIVLGAVFTILTAFTWQNALDLLLIASCFVVSVGLIFKNMLIVRLSLLANTILWSCFNFSHGLYANFACDCLTMVLLVLAMIYYGLKGDTQKEKIKFIENNNKKLLEQKEFEKSKTKKSLTKTKDVLYN